MNFKNWKTLDELAAKWANDPESVLAELRQRPYFDVAQDIYELRLELGMKQVDLAERAQTHQSRISKLEAADLDFKISTLIRVAEALGAHVKLSVEPNEPIRGDAFQQVMRTEVSTGPSEDVSPTSRQVIYSFPG